MGRTKKVGRTGRFGARYGATVRKRVRMIENKTYKPHKCPRCSTPKVKRVGLGIWKCKKCDYTFTGGCWVPVTDAGKMITRVTKSISSRT
ncbi:MAG: 50S ribosomal protein L37ae [Candidatus Odinarchaeia archaeon]